MNGGIVANSCTVKAFKPVITACGVWTQNVANTEIIEKADLVKNNNLGGLMFWDYGSDSTGTLLYRLCAEVDRINQGR